MKKAILQIFTAILVLGLFCGAATAASVSFTPNITSDPLTVEFESQSSNATSSWLWDFGDGSSNSTEQNTTHTYTSAGTYTVRLTAGFENETSDTAKNDITVSAPAESAAAFEANITKGSIPLTVAFTDNSTGATSRQWNFGDGSENSTEPNPTHTYTSAGTYKVTLTITDTGGNSRVSPTKDIEVSSTNSGDRIWEKGMPENYTWTAQSYLRLLL